MRVVALALCAAFALGGTSLAAEAPPAPPAAADPPLLPRLPAGLKARPIAFTKIGTLMQPAQEVGFGRVGAVCIVGQPITWKEVSGGFVNLAQVFATELKDAGFTPGQDPDNLFTNPEASGTDLQLGAMLKDVDVSVCRNVIRTTATVRLTVEWQVYSTLNRETVAKLETTGVSTMPAARDEPYPKRGLDQRAFAANVRALLSDPQFIKIVTTSDMGASPEAPSKAKLEPIALRGAPKANVRIADASGSVVTIFAGNGMGSGVLVSADGYVLTAQHVTGAAKTVKVRWSDGFETTGEVVRTNKARDVALIKTETHGRSPLTVNTAGLTLGASVFAIGTPLDPKLQNTVTRGVVSGSRIIDGFRYIQSDAPVTHGNSGGPLLDEHGAVIGLADWVIRPEEGSILNFFIPIGDALDFLGLKPAA